MAIIAPIIRPPGEADSFLLQLTTGCSANTCTFCGAYKNKKFSIKKDSEIFGDIEKAALRYPHTKKVFLMDGDALVINNSRLLPILYKLNTSFPELRRISSYANGLNIISRSEAELNDLYNNKLRLIYTGLESGSQKILDNCKKKSTVKDMTGAVLSAANAGIKTSLILLLGLGGRKNSEEHILQSSEVINKIQPAYLNFLTLMLIPGTPLYMDCQSGKFRELDSKGILNEMYQIMKSLELKKTLFYSNHASNYLQIFGRLPEKKEYFLRILEKGLRGDAPLTPEFLRNL